MKLTEAEIKELRNLRTTTDYDEIWYKEVIKRKLLDNRVLLHCLNNVELEKVNADADEYFGVSVLPYYIIPEVQHNVQNFVCYEVQFKHDIKYNKLFKTAQIVFYVLCSEKDLIDKDTYLARHDLLSALILKEFNWSNYFGFQMRCTSNIPTIVDKSYACRTIIFEGTTFNSITNTSIESGTSTINSEVRI